MQIGVEIKIVKIPHNGSSSLGHQNQIQNIKEPTINGNIPVNVEIIKNGLAFITFHPAFCR